MLDSFPVILIVGTVLGFLTGIGVGGGSLLMLWLSFVIGMDYPQARLINLLFFLPSAVIASFFRWKQRKPDILRIMPAIVAGCIAAGFSSWLGTKLDTTILKKLFGVLLLITGVRELYYKQRNKERP